MLPKVATQILHSTTRAAASIQHQTYTIRNVLQLQSSSGPSSGSGNLAPWNNTGSSHWGNNGPGPGGAKYSTGSRFQHGYTGAARAVTQANSLAPSDGTFSHNDETEEFPRRVSLQTAKRARIRSNSLSIPVQDRRERGEKLGVLKTVQLHARSRHVFAPASSPDNTNIVEMQPLATLDVGPRPILIRRNSTSAPLTCSENFDPTVPAPTPATFVRRNSTSSSDEVSYHNLPPEFPTSHLVTDPAAPQTIQDPARPVHESADYIQLKEACETGQATLVAEVVRHFRQNTSTPSIREFNQALEGLQVTRRPGEPLHLLLETYNDMLKHGLLPNHRTYVTLIMALCDRDFEVHKSIQTLELRLKNSSLLASADAETDRQRIETLQGENNFASAMSLFEVILTTGMNRQINALVYMNLLRSAALHSSISSAIHIFAQLEKRSDLVPKARIYLYMIQAYTNVGDLAGAEVIFQEFLSACKSGAVIWKTAHEKEKQTRAHLQLWNQMIEAYFRCGFPDKGIHLLEQMISSPVGKSFGPADIPPTATSTFTTILSGFCQMGDIPTALVWFDRLLQQATEAGNPFEITGTATKPDAVAWSVMVDALAQQGMVDDLNRLYLIHLNQKSKHNTVGNMEKTTVFIANMRKIKELSKEQATRTLSFLTEHVVSHDSLGWSNIEDMTQEIWEAYMSFGMYEAAALQLMQLVHRWEKLEPGPSATRTFERLQHKQLLFTEKVYEQTHGEVSFEVVLQLARAADALKVMQQAEYTPFFLHAYGFSRNAGTLPVSEMTLRDWELVLYAAVEMETSHAQTTVSQNAFEGLLSLLEDMIEHNIAFDKVHTNLIRRIVEITVTQRGDEGRATLESFGPSFQTALAADHATRLEQALDAATPGVLQNLGQSSLVHPTRLSIDQHQTRSVEGILSKHTSHRASVMKAYGVFRNGIERGKATTPLTIGRLIQSLGRLGEMEAVSEAYTIAQSVLQLLELHKAWQAEAWFTIEDSMIIALAHHGDIDSAHVHRMRILEQGGAPTADAYGALILNVKDTTDDTSNGMALFQESQSRGVAPNQYLYNNIISKLAKARKADYALELFQQMKTNHVAPSSITYGAVIGACARVGDVQSAELLFTEMIQARNFKPRVPPYNTMMQMYTTTKPNRERALYFYQELMKAGLLMDAYGIVEPVDIKSMEEVFQSLRDDNSVEIQGTHFATLINAYGCVQKDLDKAIDVFNSVSTYPHAPLDAVVFEALINVLVAHRRTDLIPEYITKMNTAGIHMTAYIANFLIKGYAMVGDLEHARSIFESLADPAEGMAAPNNHTPHEVRSSPIISHMDPVYREPSTWEAMVRAELGSGNRQEAFELLERLKARQYPEAVYNRISGIMVDHSMVLP
ncbi:hypothetical protein BDZ94DRAFT_1303935 [Collybia nuda]|uniref:Pentacotripeptide-repeat region of PRORP domain-containing protein n=1 Tax=Collybia nuda TaxID=64659 RepID=A0A9P5YHJ9_9AGAR|nr:hypothetical protein BDZ94DRAFT_1303935 [Collybia nuda]